MFEIFLVEKITEGITYVAKQTVPADVASVSGVRKAMGMAIGPLPNSAMKAMVVGVLLGVCTAVAGAPLSATVTRTRYGVPHVRAADWGGLGFGTGYAFAEDNVCLLADHLVTLAGELLVQAEALLRLGIHTSEIVEGFKIATAAAAAALTSREALFSNRLPRYLPQSG